MGAGSYGLFDAQAITGPSEWSSRDGQRIDTLQIHHATMTSIDVLLSLMAPGGRQVSANGAMANDGTLYEVVPVSERAFTSATSYDKRSLTLECCNTAVGEPWPISDATHRRLGKLAAQMFQQGLLGGIDRSYIIGHREVPGTYATACPGPSMNLDLVVQYAHEYLKPPKKKVSDMIHIDRLVNGAGNAYLGKTRITNDASGKSITLDENTEPGKTTIGQMRYFLDADSISEAGYTFVTSVLQKLAVGAPVIDAKALAAELAPYVSKLSEEDKKAIATYTNNELYGRLKA